MQPGGGGRGLEPGVPSFPDPSLDHSILGVKTLGLWARKAERDIGEERHVGLVTYRVPVIVQGTL